ncbi:hypothetical protein AKJ41_01800 [candidate division MSBL1 archaeon SCGC-AAA259O05]|uniref:Aminotransferase n=1 Tax=candidate division MSBL1 archaeon SCGC-AAA259O05 TaxID=1698271 RepID=A0A133V4J4_9EURY|nr:hypothetical protein AKJ41_01800 [candidate division MSBL1 archaeon SCGC-AAA259O05]
MEIADRMEDVPGSGTLEILSLANELEQKGEDVIHLEVGQPDFDTPTHIKEAAKAALEEGKTGYTSSAGTSGLRKTISGHLGKKGIERGVDEIIVTPGAKHSIFSSMSVCLDPGDEIIIPAPCWTYEGMVRIINAKPVFVEAPEENQFRISLEDIKENISSKTKMLLLNYPNNPTGAILGEETITSLLELSSDHDFWVLADEVYDEIIYEKEPESVASFSDYRDRIIYVNGFSKTYAMTGWRLGYTAGPEELISEMIKIQQNSTTCATSFVQAAGIEALQGPQDCVREMVSQYQERRDKILEGLNSIEGIECMKPQGAFYIFPNVKNLGRDSEELSKYLLKKAGVATTPGSAFGPGGEGHLRLSFANSLEKIEEALDRLKKALQE